MEKLKAKTIRVSRGFTYRYYSFPAKNGLPSVLLLHGFPDSACLWSEFINDHLLPAGYGVIALDCLGFGDSDKPADTGAYSFQGMANDVTEILDAESLSRVVSLGHDWGSVLAQRVYNFHADRVCGLVMVNVAYNALKNRPFDVDRHIRAVEHFLGYGAGWYWKDLVSDDAPEILNNHLESFWTLCHGAPETWRETKCKPGGVKKYLLENKVQPTQAYATESRKKEWIERLSRDGIEGPLQWYLSHVSGVQHEAEKRIPKENQSVRVPTLYIGGTKDLVAPPALILPSVQAGLLPHVKIIHLDAGHWSMLSQPDHFGECVIGWLKEQFSPDGAKL